MAASTELSRRLRWRGNRDSINRDPSVSSRRLGEGSVGLTSVWITSRSLPISILTMPGDRRNGIRQQIGLALGCDHQSIEDESEVASQYL
jgi:hypothetical protein